MLIIDSRIASSSVCLFLTLALLVSLLWGKWKLERMSIRGAAVLTILVGIIVSPFHDHNILACSVRCSASFPAIVWS